jgi:peptide/nickel transport system substrate-binding protein
MTTRRFFLKLGAAAALAAPATARSAPPAAPKGQVVIGMSQEPTKFNPLFAAIEVDQGVWCQVFSPLWAPDPNGNLIPRLAREIPSVENGCISEDGLTWRIRLRDGVKWHDGEPFTAADVKYTIDLINNPEFRAGRRTGHSSVRDITIVSPTELTWRLERPYATYAAILSWTFIVPKHVLEKASDPNDAPFNGAPIGTGPFRWGERVAGDHITLLANKEYFGDGPHLERLIIKYIPDLTVMYTQFRTGEIDHTSLQGITADHYADAKKLPDRVISLNKNAFVESITPNFGNPIFADPAVRQALYASINKQAVIEAIYYGLPTPTESFLPRQSWAFNPELPVQTYDIRRANAILDAAGWVRGSDGIRVKDGVRLAFNNSTTAGNHTREQTQQLLQQDWKSIGAAMTISNMPAAVIWGDFYHLSHFDSVMVGTDFMTASDPDVYDRFASDEIPCKTGQGMNTLQYANPKVDELLKQGTMVFEQAKRKALYQQAQGLIRNDLAILPIFQYASAEGIKAGLVGYQPNVNTQINLWNCGDWYWSA